MSCPNPAPASVTSLATVRSVPLRRAFSIARSMPSVSAANQPQRASLAGHHRGQDVGSRFELDLGRSIGAGQLFATQVTAGRKSATAAAITATSTSSLLTASAISCALSTRITSTLRSVDRSDVVTSVTSAPSRGGGVGDGMTHLSRRPVADEPNRVDRLPGAPRSDEDRQARGEDPGATRRGPQRSPRAPPSGRCPRRRSQVHPRPVPRP